MLGQLIKCGLPFSDQPCKKYMIKAKFHYAIWSQTGSKHNGIRNLPTGVA